MFEGGLTLINCGQRYLRLGTRLPVRIIKYRDKVNEIDALL